MFYYRDFIVVLLLFLILLFAGVAAAQQTKKLYLYNWSEYIDPSIIKQFEERYKVDVVRNFYNSNSALFAKLRSGGVSQYDVIFPSSYFVPRLIKTGLVQRLNKSKIPNLDNLKSRFRNPPYDPQGKYTVAYQWGTTGLAYNTKDLPNAPKTWAILFDSSVNKKYPFALNPDAQVMLGAACAYQGKRYDCTGRNNWKQAARLVLKTKKRPNFNGFVAGTPTFLQLARGNIDVGLGYNGDFLKFKKRDPDAFANIKFIIPRGGTELWVDLMAIPAQAPHPDLAHKFINFILKPKIGAELSNYNFYGTPNKKSQVMLNSILRKPPVTPTEAQMKRLHLTPAIKGDQLHFLQQLWTSIKSR